MHKQCLTFAQLMILLVLLGSLLLTGCGGDDRDSAPLSNQQPPPPSTFTVSGTITTASGSFMDSDVNDPNAPYSSNDTADQAQAITNPAMIGGFASISGTNIAGDRFSQTADLNDYYRCTLNKDQVITLTISDYDLFSKDDKDLDLYLYTANAPTTPVGSSMTTSEQETITVQANGDYYIRVHAVNSYTNYILTVGQPPAASNNPTTSLLDDFVPGQVMVRFKENTLPTAAMRNQLSDRTAFAIRAQALGLTGLAGGEGRSMLMSLGHTVGQQQQALATLNIRHGQAMATELARTNPHLLEKYNTIRLVKALRARADVAAADLNYIYQACKTPNDPYYRYQWHYPLINLPQAWDITTGSSTVRVAVIDTGVLIHHPDLVNKVTNTGYDFISSISMANDLDGIDANPDDPGDNSTPGNSSFHGTHVAGTVAAQSDNATGVTGVAWDTKIIPLRVLGKGGGTSYDIQQALRYAAGLSNDSSIILGVNERAHIINLSLGGSGYSQQDQDNYAAVRNQGIIVIAAAGNDNTGTAFYPASYNGVISVSAVDMNKNKAPYSNYGSKIDVAAPGGDASVDRNGDSYPDGVLSTAGDSSGGSIQNVYKFFQGTSMAAPHVAGIVALMEAVHPGLTPAQLDSELQNNTITTDIGTAGRDDLYGFGLIDALKAVQRAQALAANQTIPAALKIEPSTLNFGTSTAPLNLTTSNGGTGYLAISQVSSSATWLTVTEASVDANTKLGAYTAAIDTTNLVDGTYNATITFTSNVGTTNVPVTIEKGAPANPVNAGYHYIILYDPATKITAYTVAAANNHGTYSYSISGVAAGTYHLITGTDSDNDDYICDAGEACGGYPTINALNALTINSNLTGLNFVTSFNFGIRTAGSAADDNRPIPAFRRFKGKKVE